MDGQLGRPLVGMTVVSLIVVGAFLWLLIRRPQTAPPHPDSELEPFDRLLLRNYVDSTPTSARRMWSESNLQQQMGVLESMIEYGWIGPTRGRVWLVNESEREILSLLRNATDHELNRCLDQDKSRRLAYRVAQAELARREAEHVAAGVGQGRK